MKRYLVLALILAVGLIGCEKVAEAHTKKITTVINNLDHDNEYGPGLDLIVHEGEDGALLNKVTTEYKYDVNNENHKTYLVGTIKLADLSDKIKALFQRN